jgi:hypothetical protein
LGLFEMSLIFLFSQKADLDKEKRESQSAASAATLKSQQLEKSVLEFLEKAKIQPGSLKHFSSNNTLC